MNGYLKRKNSINNSIFAEHIAKAYFLAIQITWQHIKTQSVGFVYINYLNYS